LSLKPFCSLFQLQQLHLWGCQYVTDEELVHIKSLTNLTDLALTHIHGVNIGYVSIESLINLQKLTLFKCKFPNHELCVGGLINLVYLNILGCHSNDHTILSISSLPKLQTLCLGHTHISPSSLSVLSKMTQLRKVKIGYCLHELLPQLSIWIKENPRLEVEQISKELLQPDIYFQNLL